MGVFDDKKLENLDWMTRITETIESDMNNILAKLPNELVITNRQQLMLYMDQYTYSMSLSISSIVKHYLAEFADRRLSWEEVSKIEKCFEIDVSDNLTLDETTGIFTGEIKIIKTIATFEDEELQKSMGWKGIESLRQIKWNNTGSLGRMNEIMELMGGCDERSMKCRSYRNKINAIRERLKTIFSSNEWRIRDAELANKIGHWASDYISDGNLAAFTNFCKLKIMTHNNMPIYSIEEEVI